MSERLISDEDIIECAKADEPRRRLHLMCSDKCEFRFARRIEALVRKRLAERLTMSEADIRQAYANTERPLHVQGYVAGRHDAARIVEGNE